MTDIYREIIDNNQADRTFVLATIVRINGSSPRKVGAKMLIYDDGSITATIGGGKFEKMVIDDCLKMIKSGTKHLLKKYDFSSFGKNATGMTCGGKAEVFMELYTGQDNLVIFGGGHIGRELCRLADGSPLSVTVVDDRPEILDAYTESMKTVLTDSEYTSNIPVIDKNSFVVLVTRSHDCDRAVLSRVVNEDCTYIGMIGSKAKISKIFSSLRDSGIEQSMLDKVHTPIGLDIGAEGPYEIAVAILAQIIAVKNKAV